MTTFGAKRTTRTVKIAGSLEMRDASISPPVTLHRSSRTPTSVSAACLSLSLSLFSALRPFSSPFLVSSSLRHRYALCDPNVPSCPTAAQVRDTTRHARARDCGTDRARDIMVS